MQRPYIFGAYLPSHLKFNYPRVVRLRLKAAVARNDKCTHMHMSAVMAYMYIGVCVYLSV